MNHAQAVRFARSMAIRHCNDHDYLMDAVTNEQWEPHAWVAHALVEASSRKYTGVLPARPYELKPLLHECMGTMHDTYARACMEAAMRQLLKHLIPRSHNECVELAGADGRKIRITLLP